MKRVVLIIGNRFQANACGFIAEFEKLGGKIDGILCIQPKKNLLYYLKRSLRVVKLFRLNKIKTNLQKLSARLFGKSTLESIKSTWKILGENSWDLLDKNFDIKVYAQKHAIPFKQTKALNPEVVALYTSEGPVVFPNYAGGILSAELLNNDNAEFVNAHMGEMPRYRGMNVLEWAVLENQPTKVAVMIMNEKIDGGDVIYHKEIPVENVKEIRELRKIGYETCYEAMAKGVKEYQENASIREKQPLGAKYYYRMHPKIRMRLTKKLAIEKNDSTLSHENSNQRFVDAVL